MTSSEGTFVVQRLGASSCVTIAATLTPASGINGSMTLSLGDLFKSTDVGTTADGTIIAVGAVGVWGDGSILPNLSYACPPEGYFGVGPGCAVAPNTALLVTYRRPPAVAGGATVLQRIDVIRSGSPFPQTLVANQPPFGAVSLDFTSSGIALQPCNSSVSGWGCAAAGGVASNFLQLDLVASASAASSTGACLAAVNRSTQTLSLQGLRYSGYGYFTNNNGATLQASNWHMDDARKLLVIEPYPSPFWFNASGALLFAGPDTCIFYRGCDYVCEVYNYDSRFMDYVGLMTFTAKLGSAGSGRAVTPPRTAHVWLGNAIDAAGVFPCLMYMDAATGFYLGLDRVGLQPGASTGTYWYENVTATLGLSQLALPAQCPGTKAEWESPLLLGEHLSRSFPYEELLT